ncbi:MAG TPA: SET domain-containing protein-lysine N-methyltransferase, partial [Ferruginibacter sp.]|nr:SET domain-containing protein-lysine N-methyltransferase [Ferruginibacter sp.]
MPTNTITTPARQVISRHKFADVIQNTTTGQKSLHATVSFSPGDVICPFSAGITQDHPTYLTVQIGTSTHITLMPEFLQYINHSCEPNVFFDTTAMELVCLRPLEQGDELTFFYPSTEWEMAQPFVCNCGTPSCLQLING